MATQLPVDTKAMGRGREGCVYWLLRTSVYPLLSHFMSTDWGVYRHKRHSSCQVCKNRLHNGKWSSTGWHHTDQRYALPFISHLHQNDLLHLNHASRYWSVNIYLLRNVEMTLKVVNFSGYYAFAAIVPCVFCFLHHASLVQPRCSCTHTRCHELANALTTTAGMTTDLASPHNNKPAWVRRMEKKKAHNT